MLKRPGQEHQPCSNSACNNFFNINQKKTRQLCKVCRNKWDSYISEITAEAEKGRPVSDCIKAKKEELAQNW